MPHINIKMYPGRTEEMKKNLAKKLTEALVDSIGASEGSISVAIEEVEKDCWPKEVYKPEIIDKEATLYKKPEYGYNEEELGIKDENIVEVEGLAGGKGKAIVKHLLNKEQFNGKARLYAKITLKTGCSVGYHEHHNESETYFILSGKGQYNDNGKIRTVLPGDVTFTGDGMGHGIENVDTEDLVFIGLILL